MAVTPDTTIKLLKVPIEIDNINQLTFVNATAQYNYFNSCPKIVEEDLYYQRKDNYILFPAHIDTLLEYNYCIYQNSNYSSKWFYAFITKMEYENDGTTKIYIETDCFQTWQFDITYKKSFVEREHVNDDTIGKHTILEDLNTGSLISDWEEELTDLGGSGFYWYVIACNYDPTDHLRYAGVGSYGNYPQGNLWFAWLVNQENAIPTLEEISDWVYDVVHAGFGNYIQAMFTLPIQAISSIHVDATSHKVTVGAGGNKLEVEHSYSRETMASFNDFTPKNNKCFVYPYSFIRVTNNLGSSNDYKIEEFKDYDPITEEETGNMVFSLIGVPCQRIFWKNTP